MNYWNQKDGDPDSLLCPPVPDPLQFPLPPLRKIYGPPPYPLGFKLCKVSGHYGALFAPIPGYKYAEPEIKSEPFVGVKEQTQIVNPIPREINIRSNIAIPNPLLYHSYNCLPPHQLLALQNDILHALAPFNLANRNWPANRTGNPFFAPPGLQRKPLNG
uniref:Proline rich 1 n=1 Tax=Caenorhabditis tropicalis TaxID=1561998 RepID=A0A1I7TLL5_9PELO